MIFSFLTLFSVYGAVRSNQQKSNIERHQKSSQKNTEKQKKRKKNQNKQTNYKKRRRESYINIPTKQTHFQELNQLQSQLVPAYINILSDEEDNYIRKTPKNRHVHLQYSSLTLLFFFLVSPPVHSICISFKNKSSHV